MLRLAESPTSTAPRPLTLDAGSGGALAEIGVAVLRRLRARRAVAEIGIAVLGRLRARRALTEVWVAVAGRWAVLVRNRIAVRRGDAGHPASIFPEAGAVFLRAWPRVGWIGLDAFEHPRIPRRKAVVLGARSDRFDVRLYRRIADPRHIRDDEQRKAKHACERQHHAVEARDGSVET